MSGHITCGLKKCLLYIQLVKELLHNKPNSILVVMKEFFY